MKTSRTLSEQETVLRWDALERMVWGWTANPTEAKRWRALGYTVTDQSGGWRTQIPVEALALLPLKNGLVQVSRYLDPPVVVQASLAGDARSDARIAEQNRSTEHAARRAGVSEGDGPTMAAAGA